MEPQEYRKVCYTCFQSQYACYCPHIQKFDPKIKFVILIDHLEYRRRIATGRMSNLCLKSSHLIKGFNYTENFEVNSLLQNPNHHCVILYPGATSQNLSLLNLEDKKNLFPQNKELVVFVIDGTWNTARKMLKHSKNLHGLSQISFSPNKLSNFRVRKQPAPECLSTLEAIHHTIELLGPSRGFDLATQQHDNLIHVFNKMVELQLGFISKANPRHTRINLSF